MAEVYHQIKRKAEDAFSVVISAHASTYNTSTTVFKGMSQTELSTPRIEVICERATPEVLTDIPTGNWFCEMRVSIVGHYADKTRAERVLMECEVFDVLMRDDLITLLNNADVDDFHVYGGGEGAGEGWMPGPIETGMLGTGEIAESMSGTLYCRPSTAA